MTAAVQASETFSHHVGSNPRRKTEVLHLEAEEGVPIDGEVSDSTETEGKIEFTAQPHNQNHDERPTPPSTIVQPNWRQRSNERW